MTSGWRLLIEKFRHLGLVAREGSKGGGFVGEASIGPLQIRNGAPMNDRKEKRSYAEVVTPFSFVGGGVCLRRGGEGGL